VREGLRGGGRVRVGSPLDARCLAPVRGLTPVPRKLTLDTHSVTQAGRQDDELIMMIQLELQLSLSLSLSRSLSLSLSRARARSLSLSLTHTHTHTQVYHETKPTGNEEIETPGQPLKIRVYTAAQQRRLNIDKYGNGPWFGTAFVVLHWFYCTCCTAFVVLHLLSYICPFALLHLVWYCICSSSFVILQLLYFVYCPTFVVTHLSFYSTSFGLLST
jgi:hypothetical protein